MKILRQTNFSNKEQKAIRRKFDIQQGRAAGNRKTNFRQSETTVRDITSRANLMTDDQLANSLKETSNLAKRKKLGLSYNGDGNLFPGLNDKVAVPEEILKRGRQSSRDRGRIHGNLHERISTRSNGEVLSEGGWVKERFGGSSLRDGEYTKSLPNNFANTPVGKSIEKHKKVAEELRKKKVTRQKLGKAAAIGLGAAAVGAASYGAYKHHKNKKKED